MKFFAKYQSKGYSNEIGREISPSCDMGKEEELTDEEERIFRGDS